ncbi:hypothetical protein GB928_024305 [Shinella curvata]|uniref:Uncharacterized protein n=1 Tax=Shinella curvata TaxID=1817964 RepID=A0ABT8XKR7_9HYPH|nr:hypothetical protein [Shinella curvata]MCJ8056442.1 hypothetical protein [Shinella curvata]MDO6124320.1 hypothetical protein [Shinella curvata]
MAAGAALDLRPIVAGNTGPIVSFLLFGSLPIGATFDSDTGRIGDKVLKA